MVERRNLDTFVYGRRTSRDLNEGANITLTESSGAITVSSGVLSNVAWGAITGTLSSQIDLQSALDDKVDLISLAVVATSGDYNDLINLPIIPVILNDLSDVVLTAPSNGQVLKFNGTNWINSTDSGGVWGAITGTLSTQIDLQNALNLKADITSLDDVSFTGLLGDLDNVVFSIPSIGQVLKFNGVNWVNDTDVGGVWGAITGTLSTQIDLQNALNLKADITSLDDVAFTGLLGDLDNVSLSIPSVGQVLKFNGVNWVNDTDIGGVWGSITGTLSSQIDLQTILDGKIDVVVGPTVGNFPVLNAGGELLNSVYGPASFATAAQGALADTATQPGDNISTLTNNVGYITSVANFDDIGDVNVGTPGLPEDGYSVVWNNTAGEFQLADVVGLLPAFSGALAAKIGNQNILAASLHTILDWGAEAYDTNNYHDNVVNNSRLTIPVGVSWAKFKTSVHIQSGSTGSLRSLRFRKNGSINFVGNTEINRTDETGGHDTTIYIETPVLAVVPGDYFEVEVDNGDVGDLLVYSHNGTWFSVEVFA